jgi:hypothetical protein
MWQVATLKRAFGRKGFRNPCEMTATIRPAVIGDEELLAKLNGFVQDLHLARRRTTSKQHRVQNQPAGIGRSWNPYCQVRRWCDIDHIAVDRKSSITGESFD